MKARIVCFTIALALCFQSYGGSAGDELWNKAGDTWFEKWMNFLNEEASFTDEQKFEYFGRALGVGSNGRRTEPQEIVYQKAKKILISTPGHAEFYERRIRGHWDDYRDKLKSDPANADGSRYLAKVFYDFPVLRHLPSPETVRVLGDMVLETEIFHAGGYPIHLASQALQELHRLPVASKPVQSRNVDTERDLETYRLWYLQIKAGNRTFRFEGDPNEYTLAGAVSSPSVPASARDRIPVGRQHSLPVDAPSVPWLALALGGTLIGGAIWYWLAMRRGLRTNW